MARKYKAHFTEKKAVEYSIDIPDLEQYKDVWLILHNNAREYRNDIYKISNSYGSSTIYVLANPDSNVDYKSWLSQFGEVKEDTEKFVVVIDVECEYTKSFDEDYIDSEYMLGETD